MNRPQTVFIVDDDEGVRDGLGLLLETVGQSCQSFSDALEFLDHYNPEMGGCLVLDIRMPRMTGLDLQKLINRKGWTIPIIFITGHGDIPMAVEAMRRGALDFIRKPFREQKLLDRINEALNVDADKRRELMSSNAVRDRIATMTEREREVFDLVAQGEMNKVIGASLGISERTVEVHRAQVMKKLDVKTLAQLVRIQLVMEQAE